MTSGEDATRRERDRCVAICRRRAELWRNTASARSAVEAVRLEAMARANEATYLADLLDSGIDLVAESDQLPDA